MPPRRPVGASARRTTTDDIDAWEMHAYDATETPVDGKRSREWTAVAPTEAGVVAEMARCLRELHEGRWPK